MTTINLNGVIYHISSKNVPYFTKDIFRNAQISNNKYYTSEGESFSRLVGDEGVIKVYIPKNWRMEPYYIVVLHATSVISKIKESDFEHIYNKKVLLHKRLNDALKKGLIKK